MKLDFYAPATYRIRIEGYLEGGWSDRLAGMDITRTDLEGDGTVTTLCGWLADQGALIGVLNALYSLHLPLLSVEWLDAEPVDAEESTGPKSQLL
jgi:hypothetical protein